MNFKYMHSPVYINVTLGVLHPHKPSARIHFTRNSVKSSFISPYAERHLLQTTGGLLQSGRTATVYNVCHVAPYLQHAEVIFRRGVKITTQ